MRHIFLAIWWLFGYKWRAEYFRYLVKVCQFTYTNARIVASTSKKSQWLEIKAKIDEIVNMHQ